MSNNLSQQEVIDRFIKTHGNKYDYSKINFLGTLDKVCIICLKHGEFYQLPHTHWGGSGCAKCYIENNSRRSNVNEFIAKAKSHYGDKYDYSKFIYINNRKESIIICKDHGEFLKKPLKHLQGSGCPKCRKKRSVKKRVKKIKKESFDKINNILYNNNITLNVIEYKSKNKILIFNCQKHGLINQTLDSVLNHKQCKKCVFEKNLIYKLSDIHNNKYNYDKFVFNGLKKHSIIICPNHGDFNQKVIYHKMGNGCKQCYLDNLKYNNPNIINFVEFVKRSNLKHNNKYTYDESSYNGLNGKLKIICSIHGEFLQIAKNHMYGSSCKKCSSDARRIDLKNKYNSFIIKANIVHNYKYKYDKYSYNNIREKMKIICSKHGDFYQVPKDHLRGHGCRRCASELIGLKCRKPLYKFVEEANLIHKNKYDYSKSEYNSAVEKIIIICKIHGEFQQTPHAHLGGQGCSACSKNKSIGEIRWIKSLMKENKNILMNQTLKIGNRIFFPDGLDPVEKIVFEYYGNFFHGNPDIYNQNDINNVVGETFGELYRQTMERKSFLEENGYKVIYKWGD